MIYRIDFGYQALAAALGDHRRQRRARFTGVAEQKPKLCFPVHLLSDSLAYRAAADCLLLVLI